jgi:pimeloyl-ACP methyl ester carboxylesterase
MLERKRTVVLAASLLVAAFYVSDLMLRATAADPVTRSATGPGDEQVRLKGTWEGVVNCGGFRRGFVVRLIRKDGQWTGTIVAPAWGRAEWPLSRVVVKDKRIVMEVGPVDARPGAFTATIGDRAITGSYVWQGESQAFTMSPDPVPEAHRQPQPQFPEPPLPYETEQVSFQHGDVRIAGGLTLPGGAGLHPAVLLIGGGEGSRWHPDVPGDLDPDLTMAVWADKLTRAGIATLRTDTRGLGDSSGNKDDATLSDLADDALAGMRFLESRKEVDPHRVAVFGISEGANTAIIAAVRSDQTYLVVRISGVGVRGDKWKIEQFQRLSHALGVDRHIALEPRVAWNRQLYDLCRSERSISEIREDMERWETEQRKGGRPVPSEDLDAAIRDAAAPWMRSKLRYDPRVDLCRVRVPILDVHGDKDVFVPTDQSVPEIEKALKESGNPDATVITLGGLDHFMRKSETGVPTGDPMDQDVVDPAALHLVTEWIGRRMSPGGRTKEGGRKSQNQDTTRAESR